MWRVTKRSVDSEEPEASEKFRWDADLRGFGIRVHPSGRKTYVVQYRISTGRTRRLTLGQHGHLTPFEARTKARELLLAVALGQDPAREKKKAREALTVEQLAERYLEEHAEPKKKPASVALDRRLLSCCVLPALRHLKVKEVSRADVSSMHHRHRSTPVQANRALGLLSKMMNLAEVWGLREDGTNPCRRVEKFKESPRERLLSAQELSQLGATLSEAEERDQEHPSTILAIRLLLLTGARKSEILELRWSEVDLDRASLRLQDSKTGAKVIPLGSPALELLRQVKRQEDNPHVCWGNVPGHHLVGLQKAWKRVCRRAGLSSLRLHDLRHSFASTGAAAGMSMPILGAILGHTQPSTTNRYLHFQQDPLVAAADQVSSQISAALRGSWEEKSAPKVDLS